MLQHIKIASVKYRRVVTPVLFGVFVVLWSIGFPWFIQGIFFFYGAFIFWTLSTVRKTWSRAPHAISSPTEPPTGASRWVAFAAISSLGFLLATRLVPFIRFGEAPLGYDTGFYVGSLKALASPTTLTISALYLTLIPFFAAGLPPLFLFHFFHVLFQLFLAGSVYFLISSLSIPFRNRLATCAMALFSLSAVQFLGYWWAFTQQMLGMGFFLIALALLIRGSPWMIVFVPMTLLMHTSTGAALFLSLIVLSIIYSVQLCFKRRYVYPRAAKMLAAGVLLASIAFMIKRSDIANVFSHVLGTYGILLSNAPPERLNEFRGLFVDTEAFRLLVLGFIPFSIFTVLHPSTWIRQPISRSFFYRQLLLLYSALLTLLLLTLLPVIYQSRFSIVLDLIVLVFATPAFLLFVEYFSTDRAGRLLVGLLLTFPLVSIGLYVAQQQSMIASYELQNIKKIPSLIGAGAGILATDSLYAPWLWGLVGPNTVSPGYLGDSWDYATWMKFWSGTSNEKRLQLLGSRDHPQPPMYLYIGERQTRGLPFEKFVRTSSAFTQITPNLWKFTADPRAQPAPSLTAPASGTTTP